MKYFTNNAFNVTLAFWAMTLNCSTPDVINDIDTGADMGTDVLADAGQDLEPDSGQDFGTDPGADDLVDVQDGGDQEPPANVSDFTATLSSGQVTLTWTNPQDPDFYKVKVVRKLNRAPGHEDDGQVVYDDNGATTVDTAADFYNGSVVYYKAFSYDLADNYSDGVPANASLWAYDNIDSTCNAIGLSIAVDTDHSCYVSYYNTLTQKAICSSNKTGDWALIRELNSNNLGATGVNTSIALDSSGKYHVSYNDRDNSGLYYANNSANPPGLIDSGGYMNILAIDKSDNNTIHITHQGGALKYAIGFLGDIWNTYTIEANGPGNVGYQSALAIDPNHQLHIVYRDIGDAKELKYVTGNATSWAAPQFIPPNGSSWGNTAISVDASLKVHILYHHPKTGSLYYATNQTGVMQTNMVLNNLSTETGGGGNVAIVFDANQKFHACSFNQKWKYYTNISGSVLTYIFSQEGGSECAIGVDEAGKVFIAYTVCSNQGQECRLKFATNRK